MAIRFSKRFKIAPGLNLNLSKRGIGTSIGPKGMKIGLNRKGTYVSGGIPGTGIYAQKYIGKKSKGSPGTKSNSSGCLMVFGILILLGAMIQYPLFAIIIAITLFIIWFIYRRHKKQATQISNTENSNNTQN